MGLKMTWITAHQDLILFIIGIIIASCGYYIGRSVGYEDGMDTGVMAGKDLASMQYRRANWQYIGDEYLMSQKDGSIVRQISESR